MAEVNDLNLAVATLLAKTQRYTVLWDYYSGRQPLVYSYERLSDIFSKFNARFSQNWCGVVVDSVQERLALQRITIADNEAQTKQLATLLSASSLLLEAADVHLGALVTGESYVIVWPDEETEIPEAYYNDSRNVHLFYQAASPRKKRFACKWWIGDDDYRYLTLYYPDRLEYYRSRKRVRNLNSTGTYSANEVQNGKGFEQTDAAANPYGVIPVFHFRRDRRVICSELMDIIEPQDAINKLLADMMVAAEFGAFKQRYVITNAITAKLENAPNKIWEIPAADGEGQNTSVGEFDATPLENYLGAIDKWVNFVAIRSRTPKHYFFGQGGDPSGEALIAMEAPLNHKAEKYINVFMEPWTEVGQFMAQLGGLGDIPDDAIIPVFDKPQTVQPYTQVLIRKEAVAAGVPLLWHMAQEGYTEQELAELEAAINEQAAQSMERMAQVMEQRSSNFAQNGARQNGQPPQGTPQSA
jgi:hypothetical protein